MSHQISRRSFVRGGLAAMAGLGALGLAGCGGGGDATAPDDTLVFLSMVPNDCLCPFASVGADKPVQHAMFDTLYRFDPEGDVVPMLVESEAEDGLSKTLTLRGDVTFSSGAPLRASDVVFSFSRIQADPSMGAFSKTYVTAVEALDERTVRVDVASSAVPWRNFLAEALYVVEEASFDPSNDYVSEAPVGSGAYVFESVDSARTVTLRANEGYWGGAPAFKTAQVKAPVDGSTALVSLQTGETDFVAVLAQDNVAAARQDESLCVTDFDSWSNEMLGVYVGDEKFRQAVFHAIDRQNIIDICNDGTGSPSVDMCSKKVMGEYAGIVDFVGYDLDLARECIAQSKTDLSQTFEIMTFDSANVAQCIQEDLKKIGVSVEVSTVDANTFFSAVESGSLQMFVVGLGTDMQNVQLMLPLLFGPDSTYSFSVSDDFKAGIARLDECVAAGGDPHDAIADVCSRMAVECPIVPLYDVNYHDVYRREVGNVSPSSSGTYVYYFGDYTIEA